MTVLEEPRVTRSTGAVSLRGITKRFGTGPNVLEDVSLDVAQGEFLCLLGASGCGKSTLLSLMAGLDAVSAGTIDVPGHRPALMFQEPALFPWLTASQNIELALRLGGVKAKRERGEGAAGLLALVRLRDAGARGVHELPGGMRRGVARPRPLPQDSPLLLMDEP